MAADGESNPFKDGRASLRETAKWMVSGTLAGATLIAGSSTFSQLGSMDPTDWRFWTAVTALVLAVALCWLPFIAAVRVLRCEVLSLQRFTGAEAGEYHDAAAEVSKILGKGPEGKDLHEFARDYLDLRKTAWRGAASPEDKQAAVAYLDDYFQTCRQACISELVAQRFDRLVGRLAFPGVLILGAFLVFTWAANPPKEPGKLLDHPRFEPLTAEHIADLVRWPIDSACYGPGAQLVAAAEAEAGPQTLILIPPPNAGCKAPLHKAVLSAGRIVRVD